eukprot:s963_g4.t1
MCKIEDGIVPISQCSEDADAAEAEEITLRCRFGIWKVKKEVEEPEDSSAAKVPGASKGDLRHFFRQRSESRPGSDEELQPLSPRPGFSALQTKISMASFFINVLFALMQFTVADMLEKTAAPRGSGQLNLVPTLEEPSSSWLLQEDGDTEVPMDSSHFSPWTGIQKRPALPNIPDVLILALAALTLGVSVLLREFCRADHDQKQQKLISVKPSETTDAFGCTELHVAASEGSALNVRKLLESGSDPNAREAWEEKCFKLLTKNMSVE